MRRRRERIPIDPGEIPLGLRECICCACGRTRTCRNIICTEFCAPEPGTGWGCVVCHLPQDGAVAVVCDDCAAAGETSGLTLRYICTRGAGEPGRTPVQGLRRGFGHNMSFHVGTFTEN